MKKRILASLFAVMLALPLSLTSCNNALSEYPETYACSCHECVESRRESVEESIAESVANKEAAEKAAAYREFYNSRTQLLKDLLDDDYYNYLINLVKTNKLSSESYIAPHPFAFLEEQGHDVARVRSGALSCTTHTFTKDEEPNKLYMAVYVENDGEYYTEYLLRYTLTEKEMSDYEMLFDKRVLQIKFINDQISKSKTPEILIETNMNKISHDELVNDVKFKQRFTRSLDNKCTSFDFVLSGFDEEKLTFTLKVFSAHKGEPLIHENAKITTFTLAARFYEDFSVENNILTSPYKYTSTCVYLNQENTEEIKYFYCNDYVDIDLIDKTNNLNK